MGPTASGKSAACLAIAARWPIEIINVDSATIYRGMDIGTAKPSLAEQAQSRAQTINSGNFHQLDQVMRKLGQLGQGVTGDSVQENEQQPEHLQPINSTILE